ncbi:hypothetical protein GINT2_001189 [Glugoides intestinalis]
MHPQDFRSITDHLYDAYCSLHEEIHRLKRENKALFEELTRAKNTNANLNAKLSTLNTSKIIKMGAEWVLDGKLLFNISLMKRIKFTSPICNAKISNKGQIAFTCNKKIFLLNKDKILLVEDTVKIFDIKTMNNDLIDMQRQIFDFIGEDLVVYQRNNVIKFKNLDREWFLELENVIQIQVCNELIYIGTSDGFIHIYSSEGIFMRTVEVNNTFKYFIVKNNELVVVSEGAVTLLPTFKYTENEKTTAVAFDGQSIYHGESTGVVANLVPSGGELQQYDTIGFKSHVLSLMKFQQFLFCATEDRTVTILDLETRKTMRIMMMDNVIDMCSNENSFCFVDNNGGMKVWEINK